MMSDGITFVFFAAFAFIGALFGHNIGASAANKAIAECEKTLPRNVQCTIIAVPVDKN
jgi:hypothetical protein